MTTALLPQSFWFRLAVPCRKGEALPRTGGKRLLDLPASCRLPQTALLDGREPWSDVRVAWNARGLAVSVEAEGTLKGLDDDNVPEGSYGFHVWVDTRDTRDVSRATRFCHRFDARLAKGKGKNGLEVKVQPRPIARAVADAPLAKADAIASSVERTRGGWRLELFFYADALNGFDPETNRRLGFAYHVFDPERPGEFLGAGREFPVGENPSLWSTLELVETK